MKKACMRLWLRETRSFIQAEKAECHAFFSREKLLLLTQGHPFLLETQ